MKINILANQIFELREINYLELTQEQIKVTEERFNNLCEVYLNNLKTSNENEEMYKIVIEEWKRSLFPIPLMFKTYQRLIEIKQQKQCYIECLLIIYYYMDLIGKRKH